MDDMITEVKLDKRGALVTVNHSERLWFNRSAWQERSFQEGEAVELQELKSWLLPRQYTLALHAAVAYLAARPQSSGELDRKLQAKQILPEAVELVIYKLEKEGLLDDEAFARDWAAARARKQVGRNRILQELRMKGVEREIAERAVGELDPDECADPAVALAHKLLRRYENEEPYKAVQKFMAAMARRGYPPCEARSAMNKAKAQD
ncbi:MAG: regulatory protein RecX [Clostridia bacterium]